MQRCGSHRRRHRCHCRRCRRCRGGADHVALARCRCWSVANAATARHHRPAPVAGRGARWRLRRGRGGSGGRGRAPPPQRGSVPLGEGRREAGGGGRGRRALAVATTPTAAYRRQLSMAVPTCQHRRRCCTQSRLCLGDQPWGGDAGCRWQPTNVVGHSGVQLQVLHLDEKGRGEGQRGLPVIGQEVASTVTEPLNKVGQVEFPMGREHPKRRGGDPAA